MDRLPRHRVEDLTWEDGEALAVEQHALRADADRVAEWGERHPEVFAGLWKVNEDWLAGLGPVRLCVGVTPDHLEQATAELRGLVDQPERLVLVPKRLPYSVLHKIQLCIVDAYMDGRTGQHQPDVTGVGVDVDANLVRVMLAAPDAEAEEALRQEFGRDRVAFEYGRFESL